LAAHYAGLLQLTQALSEDVGAELRKSRPQVGESLRPEQQLADNQQRPALADDVQRTCNPAPVAIGSFAGHAAILARA